ncbi:MAG: SDR family oxidoreductase [Bacteroidetes bacterium]|nr:SDR family oxidoreductase [Fibrella sp.]
MNVLIVGASGLVGSHCLAYFSERGMNVVGTHHSYASDGTVYFNPGLPVAEGGFDPVAFDPDVIIHCAALTNVDYCEQQPAESYENTVESTRRLLAVAKTTGATFVYISTDYVFDGADGPYTETASPRPINCYGQHKLMAERAVTDAGDNHLIIRITNVYGTEARHKNFIARMLRAIRAGDHLALTVPFDQFSTPINASDVARAVHALITQGKNGIYHLASTDFLSRSQLIDKVLNRFQYTNTTVLRAPTAELNQAARRPLNGGLLPTRFMLENPYFVFSSVDDFLNAQLNN